MTFYSSNSSEAAIERLVEQSVDNVKRKMTRMYEYATMSEMWMICWRCRMTRGIGSSLASYSTGCDLMASRRAATSVTLISFSNVSEPCHPRA